MTVSVVHEMTVFGSFVLCGLIVGAIFDFFRALRKNIPHGKVLVAFEDVFFCILAFRLFFDICYYSNNGRLRWYIFASFVCSSIIYFCTASKTVIKIWSFFISLILKFLVPIKKCATFFCRIIKGFFVYINEFIKMFFIRYFKAKSQKFRQKLQKPSKIKGLISFFFKKPFTFSKK